MNETERLLRIVGGELQPPEFDDEIPAEIIRARVGGNLKIRRTTSGWIGVIVDGDTEIFETVELESPDAVYQACIESGFYPENREQA